MNKNNYLYLIWKNPSNRRNYTVGRLEKNENSYAFEYCNEYEEAQKDGWGLVQAFPEIKRYESEGLFPVFSSRLPDRKRRNIEEILRKYGLSQYDGYELLKKSGGRLPIDTYEFINPIFEDDGIVEREFYIVGIRHLSGCEGKACDNRPRLEETMELELLPEPTNEYDKYAIQVQTKKKELLGYIPRYYSQSVWNRLRDNGTYNCVVTEICDEKKCQQCVKVKLRMSKKSD